MNKEFSFIILTYNEEIHLPRLLDSITALNAPIFIVDSGSIDNTVEIATTYHAKLLINPFENHPKQWDFALKTLNIETPWVIGLDADQIVSDHLFQLLSTFKNEDFTDVHGIYFNRKNYFQGRWIRFGGYYPFYMLKMFRTEIGYSDLNENMDHRFIVPGQTKIWKSGYLLEENLKENDLSFWKAKHERYSDLIAIEEIERARKLRLQIIKTNFKGNPDEIRAFYKNLWRKLPFGIRPYLYFTYRMFFKLGVLEGWKGIHFHYLQSLWFRKLVDKKIKERMKKRNEQFNT